MRDRRVHTRAGVAGLTTLAAAALLAASVVLGEDVEEPVAEAGGMYVGVEPCVDCHTEFGSMSSWTGSKHARSYVVLSTELPALVERRAEPFADRGYAAQIRAEATRLDKDTECLGCHATATDVDPAQIAPTFHVEDGVQCEACHGPLGKHLDEMLVAQKTAPAPLPSYTGPAPEDFERCLECHREKPTHEVLGVGEFDRAARWKKIEHPVAKP